METTREFHGKRHENFMETTREFQGKRHETQSRLSKKQTIFKVLIYFLLGEEIFNFLLIPIISELFIKPLLLRLFITRSLLFGGVVLNLLNIFCNTRTSENYEQTLNQIIFSSLN